MPKYVVERQYLLPVYQHLIIEADSVEDACQKAVDDDDWESATEDGDGSRGTTITAIKPIPDTVNPDEISPANFLYEGDTTGINDIPERFKTEID
jgi:hypothetical protein